MPIFVGEHPDSVQPLNLSDVTPVNGEVNRGYFVFCRIARLSSRRDVGNVSLGVTDIYREPGPFFHLLLYCPAGVDLRVSATTRLYHTHSSNLQSHC